MHSVKMFFFGRRAFRSLPAIGVSLVFFLNLLATSSVLGQTLAFPGAEGFGRFATGGDVSGATLYHVTNTNDSGPGSFRDAVSVSGRTIVFDVGGIIDYQPPRYAPKPNITIAGQTAPGDGVTIYGNGLSFSGSHNNIVRFIRVREGINGDSGTDAMGIANGHDMIFDHMSISWGRDETFSVSGDDTANITIQSCIISQGLQTHSAGGLIQSPGGVSILRCLYIDNDTRNPKVKLTNEFVNNLVLNWESIGYNMGGESEGESTANVFNNYFIKGPNSSSAAIYGGGTNPLFHIYATNNWFDSNQNGVLDGTDMPYALYGPMDARPNPFTFGGTHPPITNAYPPLTALKLALSDVGASQHRDSVDERLMYEVRSWGTIGQTISSEYNAPMSGPGIIRNGVAPLDTDQDGLPDYWELALGSSTTVSNTFNSSLIGSPYKQIGDYLNWLGDLHGAALTNTPVAVDLRQFTCGFTNFGASYSVANPTNGTVVLVGDHTALFTPVTGHTGLAAFQFTVVDTNSSTITRTMNLVFTPQPPARSILWHGDDATNNWNVLGDNNWHDGMSLLFQFKQGDAVTFDNSGSISPAVNLIGSLQPASVSVNAAQSYTFDGSGSLDGSMTLTKAGNGTLRLNNENTYTGATTVSNGTMLVNGAIANSAVTVKAGGGAGGGGFLGNGLTVQSSGVVIPGDGISSPGILTITNGLTESGGVTNRFDLSDDPTGITKTNDEVHIVGDLNVSGVNVIRISLLDGLAGNGVYILFTYTGNFNGNLSNFSLSGVNGILTNPPNAVAIIVSSVRPPASLVWNGDGVNNIWDTGTNVTWLNDGAPDRFYFLDDVLFDDSGSTTPSVSLKGDLTPNSATVDASVNYTFSGSGKITGTTGLTKSNTGTLTVSTTNDYTGPTVINGGRLSVARLVNGNLGSSVGGSSSDPANLVISNGTLRYTGSSTSTDRGMTLGGSATLDVNGNTLTANGQLIGTGTLVKAGAGTLVISTNNLHGATTISNGTVNLTTTYARDDGLGSGTTTLAGGTLQLYGYAGSTSPDWGTFDTPLNVPTNTFGNVLTPPRYSMQSALTGGGQLNLTVDYVRGAIAGNWSAFAGTINVLGKTLTGASNEFRVATSLGFPNATVILNTNAVMTRNGGSSTITIGALGGSPLSWVGPGNSSSGGTTYNVGGNNRDATFQGTIKNDGTTTFIKSGTGQWILTGANSWSGGLTINGGIVLANNTSGSAVGSGAVTANSGGAIGGTGSVGASVTVNSGGAISPGASAGTLTINGSLALNSGSQWNYELGSPGTGDKVIVNGALSMGGTLNITNAGGFGAGTYTLMTYTGTLSGTPPTIGAKPSGFGCSISTATANQVQLIVTVLPPPSISSVTSAGGNVIFSGIGPTNDSYYVLSATNVDLPMTNWSPIATNVFSPSGTFSITNVIDTNTPTEFFRLQLPQ